jgi:hypothetical protein
MFRAALTCPPIWYGIEVESGVKDTGFLGFTLTLPVNCPEA